MYAQRSENQARDFHFFHIVISEYFTRNFRDEIRDFIGRSKLITL